MRWRARRPVPSRGLTLALSAGLAFGVLSAARAADEPGLDLTATRVKDAIDLGQRFLLSQRNPDGSFGSRIAARMNYNEGATSLAVLALLSSGRKLDDPAVAGGLRFLRNSRDQFEPFANYQAAVMIMALAAARQPERDAVHVRILAQRLEAAQVAAGERSGMWNYGHNPGSEDHSNTQMALLGLREAALYGVAVDPRVWERAADHFARFQNADGGWGYRPGDPSTGSMTCAGIGSLLICEQMLGPDRRELSPDGSPRCCDASRRMNPALRRGIACLERSFAVGVNPGQQGGLWTYYYTYGVERVGRLTGKRFFGPHDWYREGARWLLDVQARRDGSWHGAALFERDPVIPTSFALLFLSKGLAPVLINKLDYATAADEASDALPNWNRHPGDARKLAEFAGSLPKWPPLLSAQEVALHKNGVDARLPDLLQAPILYVGGVDAPTFSDRDVALLRSYVEQGGFIFAVNHCNGAGFEDAIRKLVPRIYPPGVALRRLPPDHPIFRAEFPLDPQSVELLGVDFGCRTSLVFAPRDYACLWDLWSPAGSHRLGPEPTAQILGALRVGVNVAAYATGREPYDKLDAPRIEPETASRDKVDRDLLHVALLRHTGDWDAAPRALYNVLLALRTSGIAASTRQRDLDPVDPNLFRYPLAFMHGRAGFQLNQQELKNLREYLRRGAVLFADACCGSAAFDQSFREMVRQLYPNRRLERIPISHELFSTRVGFDIHKVKRRIPEGSPRNAPLDPSFHEGEPYLEGIKIDGRYLVIYSKYDLSCAIERQASIACAGYEHRDAVRIAVNIIRYALLQDISYVEQIR